jgi:MFS superfamily sulfate permease-like transporter
VRRAATAMSEPHGASWPLPSRLPFGGAVHLGISGCVRNEVLAGCMLVDLSLPMNIGYASVAGPPPT